MPWLYIGEPSGTRPGGISITDDDADEIAIVSGIQLESNRESIPMWDDDGGMRHIGGRVDHTATLDVWISNYERFVESFSLLFKGRG